MSKEISELVGLYSNAFGVLPSKESSRTLIALEMLCKLSKDDIMAPVVVAQMRALDNMHGLVEKFDLAVRSNDDRLAQRDYVLFNKIENLVQANTRKQKRRFWHPEKERRKTDDWESYPLVVPVYRVDFPILSFLRQAFDFRDGVLERDERIVAARQSLLYIIPCLAILFMSGMLISHYFLEG